MKNILYLIITLYLIPVNAQNYSQQMDAARKMIGKEYWVAVEYPFFYGQNQIENEKILYQRIKIIDVDLTGNPDRPLKFYMLCRGDTIYSFGGMKKIIDAKGRTLFSFDAYLYEDDPVPGLGRKSFDLALKGQVESGMLQNAVMPTFFGYYTDERKVLESTDSTGEYLMVRKGKKYLIRCDQDTVTSVKVTNVK